MPEKQKRFHADVVKVLCILLFNEAYFTSRCESSEFNTTGGLNQKLYDDTAWAWPSVETANLRLQKRGFRLNSMPLTQRVLHAIYNGDPAADNTRVVYQAVEADLRGLGVLGKVRV